MKTKEDPAVVALKEAPAYISELEEVLQSPIRDFKDLGIALKAWTNLVESEISVPLEELLAQVREIFGTEETDEQGQN